MKKFGTIFAAVLLFAFLTSCGNKTDEALQYSNKLVELQTNVYKAFITFSNSMASADMPKIKENHQLAVKAANDALDAIKKIEPFDGDDNLRLKMQALLEFYLSILNNEFKEAVAIIEKGTNATPEDIIKINALSSNITQKEAKLDSEAQAAQKAFSEKYKFTLQTSEIQKEVDNMSK